MTGGRGKEDWEEDGGTADCVTERDRGQPTHIAVLMMTVDAIRRLSQGVPHVSTAVVKQAFLLMCSSSTDVSTTKSPSVELKQRRFGPCRNFSAIVSERVMRKVCLWISQEANDGLQSGRIGTRVEWRARIFTKSICSWTKARSIENRGKLDQVGPF